MNDQHKKELLALIESLARNVAANDALGAACVRAEIHRRIAAIPAPQPPAPAPEAV